MIELAWPPRQLRPNASSPGAWRIKSEAAKAYREQAYWRTKHLGLRFANTDEATCTTLRLTFNPPDNRKRDLDNMLASVKSGIDGICDALAINDHCFTEISIVRGPALKGGKVTVVLG